jgi:hypothetical protein
MSTLRRPLRTLALLVIGSSVVFVGFAVRAFVRRGGSVRWHSVFDFGVAYSVLFALACLLFALPSVLLLDRVCPLRARRTAETSLSAFMGVCIGLVAQWLPDASENGPFLVFLHTAWANPWRHLEPCTPFVAAAALVGFLWQDRPTASSATSTG